MNSNIYNNYMSYLITNNIPKSILQFSNKTISNFRQKAKLFHIKNNKLYYNTRIVIKDSELNAFLTDKWINPATGLTGMNKFCNYTILVIIQEKCPL